MTWQEIEGHDEVADAFRRAIQRGRLASTFLFVGPAGIGKRTFAVKLGHALLCQATTDDPLLPCGQCPSCVQAAAGTHPDLLEVAKPKDKSAIPVELFIGADDRRMREGLCHDIALKPFMGGRRVAIIDDADDLNREGANCLLKVLEEPPPRSVLILIGTTAGRQLPTIRSRAQIVRFRPLAADAVARLLLKNEIVDNKDQARRLAVYSEGSLRRAAELNDPDLWEFRKTLFVRLAEPVLESLAAAKAVNVFVDAAGKEAVRRRARARQVILFAAEFYRQLLRAATGAATSDDEQLQKAVRRKSHDLFGGPETAARCVDRCLEALEEIDRNANQTTLVECWTDDLSRITTGRRPVSV